MAVKLKPGAKIGCSVVLLAAIGAAAYFFYLKPKYAGGGGEVAAGDGRAGDVAGPAGGPGDKAAVALGTRKQGVYRVALSEWPGHMPLVIGNGGLATAGGSVAQSEGLSLEIVFIEDPVQKNEALQKGEVDFVWQVVDEMPINMGGYKDAGVDARAMLQIDWSRGGDACVASKDISKVEDIRGRKAAMMMFSPDHTVFEFMINNSRLTIDQIAQVRKDAMFSPDDFTYGRKLFVEGKVDVACLWEPDVSLALSGRPGSHRLFSTADATDLVADVLLARKDFLDREPEVAAKVARTWLGGAREALRDKPKAARMIAQTVPRFRDELGEQDTLKSFGWVKWADLADNAEFFGLDGKPPSFDRVYNQADRIWTSYPQAKISQRFAPQGLRDERVVKRLVDDAKSSGAQVARTEERSYDRKKAETGEALFTKPVTINFNSGQSELDAESMHILNTQVLPQLEMARAMYVRVEGNTDDKGSAGVNQTLSLKRAQAVAQFLVERGVNAARISAKGNGPSNPVATNKTEDGRAQNRRTDILFISSGS